MAQAALRLVEGQSMDKAKALDAALSQIERAFGKGSIMRLGKNEKSVEIETVSTGSIGLDIALGVGGLPRGRVVEIYGPESSGKTTLALHTVAEAQKKGGVCGFIDAEHALDPIYAKKLGVNLEDLLISQPDTGEQGLELADTLVRSGAIDVLVCSQASVKTLRSFTPIASTFSMNFPVTIIVTLLASAVLIEIPVISED
jgi:recombination protein RecA